MCTYVYGYNIVREYDEVFFKFPAFPEIVTSRTEEEYAAMDEAEREGFAHDAIVAALQSHIYYREEIPGSLQKGEDGFDGCVALRITEGMKLQLYQAFLENCSTVAELAEKIGKQQTAASRLLDLRHNSRNHEIEEAMDKFDQRLVPDWRSVPNTASLADV